MVIEKPRHKRIVLTMIPGAGWDAQVGSFPERLVEKCKDKLGVRANLHSVRDAIYSLAASQGIKLDPTRMYRASDEKVRLLRQLAFNKLEEEIRRCQSEDHESIDIINTRATSYSPHGKEESLTREILSRVAPDLLAVVIDDPIEIFQRIPTREETKKYGNLEIDDIIRWMENEVSEMEKLAKDSGLRLFVIPRQQEGALAELIGGRKKSAYASYPMTASGPQIKAQTARFVSKLKERYVVFDPACMGTAHADFRMNDKEQSAYRQNVRLRDEQWFIRINSELVVVYLPDKVAAHGSQSELVVASEQGKTVWVVLEPAYTDAKGKLTPFIEEPADHVFVSFVEFEFFLGLSESEQTTYQFLGQLMWRFKRRGDLTPLISRSLGIDQDKEILEQFREEAGEKYERESSRQMLPSVDSKVLDHLIESCWEHNRALWRPGTEAEERPLFEEPRVLPMAARSANIADERGVDEFVEPRSRIVEHKPNLPDIVVFRGILWEHARGKIGDVRFANLRKFFEEDHLGEFEETTTSVEFLNFLRDKLDEDKTVLSRVWEVRDLRDWYGKFLENRR